jgi:hypothetical protein
MTDKLDIKKNNKIEQNIVDSNSLIIDDALEYYDKAQEKYRDNYINVHYISIETTEKDLEHNVMIFYDSNLKELFRSRFERIGIFDIKSNLWIWAWAISKLKKNETNIIRKILFYGTELDPETIYLKTELITSRFKITNKTQLDIHCAVASYLSKKNKLFNYRICGSTKIIDNKYVDIINQDLSMDNTGNYDLISYIFLLD